MYNIFRIIFSGFCCFAYLSNSISAQSTNGQDQVLALHRDKFEWMVLADTARLSGLMADDIHYVHSNGWHERKSEMITNLSTQRLKYHQIEVLYANVRQYRDMYIINGRGKFDVALDDKAWVLELDYTEVYIWQDNRFLLVSRHACRPPEQE